MKRHFPEILLFLLLGAVINAAVAWGCALCLSVDPTVSSWARASYGLSHHDGDDSQYYDTWSVQTYQRPAACRILSEAIVSQRGIMHTLGPTAEDVSAACPHGRIIDCRPMKAESRAAVLDARGWPILSLSSAVYCDSSPRPLRLLGTRSPLTQHPIAQSYANCEFQVEWGIALPRPDDTAQHWVAGNYVLPLRPLWPGFAINTLLYAAILWLLLRAPFVFRRLSRRRRGCCLKCGYDLRGDFVGGCPECGWNRTDVTM